MLLPVNISSLCPQFSLTYKLSVCGLLIFTVEISTLTCSMTFSPRSIYSMSNVHPHIIQEAVSSRNPINSTELRHLKQVWAAEDWLKLWTHRMFSILYWAFSKPFVHVLILNTSQCSCTNAQVWIFMPGHVWEPGVGCLGLSLNLEFAVLAKLAGQGVLGSVCLHHNLVPQGFGSELCILSSFFMWLLGIQTQVSYLCLNHIF